MVKYPKFSIKESKKKEDLRLVLLVRTRSESIINAILFSALHGYSMLISIHFLPFTSASVCDDVIVNQPPSSQVKSEVRLMSKNVFQASIR